MGSDPLRVAIALGSNLGNRRENLDYALSALSLDLADIKCSSFQDTSPVGVGEEHAPYLNAAVVGLTRLSPHDLLDRLLAIEDERGRMRPYPMAPRTLDLDLILYGDSVIDEAGLLVPHPRFRERAFVLSPLAEIAPNMVDPVTGKTVQELLLGIGPSVACYKDLKVWQLSMDLVDVCFDIVEALPQQHHFTFSNQLLPAAISIPANISEGSRRSRKSYLYHLSVSLGSQAELETLLEIIRRRAFAPMPLVARATEMAETVGKMLHALVRSLEPSNP